MKYTYSLIALFAFFFTYTAKAQDTDYYVEETKKQVAVDSSFKMMEAPASLQKVKRTQFSLDAGTMFGRGFWGNNFTTYIAPKVSYQLTKRLQISGGVMMINSHNYFSNAEFANRSMPQTSYIMFTSGSYQVNDRLLLSGMAYYDAANQNSLYRQNAVNNTNIKGMSVYAEYKISPSISISAGVSSRSGNMYGQPFGGGFNNRFGNGMW